jgi:hypothetical protein
MGFNDKWLMLSSEHDHNNFETLEHYIESFQRSGTNGYSTINLNSIREIKYHEKHSEFFIRYESDSKKLKRYYLSIESNEIRKDFCASFSKACILNSKKESVNHFARIWPNTLIIAVSLFLTEISLLCFNVGLYYPIIHAKQIIADLLRMKWEAIITVVGALVIIYFSYKITELSHLIKPILSGGIK